MSPSPGVAPDVSRAATAAGGGGPSAAGERQPGLPTRMSLALGSGTILLALNSAVVSVALVPIARDLGGGDALPWIVSGLYVAAAVGSPTGGRLADLFGPRRVYLAGLAVLLLAAVAGPFVPSAGWLVAVRVVMGLGTAVQFPASMAVIRRQAARRGADPAGALGVVAVCGQSVAALGPTVGGLIVQWVGWQGIFWINLPMVVHSAVWVLTCVPRDDPRPPVPGGPRARAAAVLRQLDLPGVALFVLTMVLLMIGLLSLQDEPLWWALALSVPAGAAFAWRELRADGPVVDVRLVFGHRRLAYTCGRAVLTFVSFYCVFYGLPQWLEQERGLSAGAAGALMFPVFAVGVLSTTLASRLSHRLRPRMLLVLGTAAMVLAGALMSTVVDRSAPLVLVVVVNALLGLPNGFNNLGNQLLLHHAVPERAAGSASGVYRTAQYVGAALSAVIVAHVVGDGRPDGGAHDLGHWILGLGAAMLVTNLVAYLRRSDEDVAA